MRALAHKVRLLGWLLALAVALPVSPLGWAATDEGSGSSPVARQEAGTSARPAICHAPLRAGWHGACTSLADPDEPDEGSDGWVSALGPGLPAPFGLNWTVLDAPGIFSHPPRRPPLPVGTLCRLRC